MASGVFGDWCLVRVLGRTQARELIEITLFFNTFISYHGARARTAPTDAGTGGHGNAVAFDAPLLVISCKHREDQPGQVARRLDAVGERAGSGRVGRRRRPVQLSLRGGEGVKRLGLRPTTQLYCTAVLTTVYLLYELRTLLDCSLYNCTVRL